MQPLMLHQTCDLGPIRAITADIRATSTGCEARFRLEGDISRIAIPEAAASQRADELWQTTCCEIFWQPIGDTRYFEFNLSPSTQWAAYRFDRYREGMEDFPVDAIHVSASQESDGLDLTAQIAAELPAPAQVGVTAVVEHEDGAMQYWAMAFARGKPDFHSEACRQWIIERD